MTYEEVDALRECSEEQAQVAQTLTEAVEKTLEKYPFRGMPRSVRFLGAGNGCLEIFCGEKISVIRNNDGVPEALPIETADIKEAYKRLIALIYFGRKDSNFAKECCEEFF